ncbi:DnaB-like dsDNA helicase [Stenotrophomonas phage Summit]|nr:DnaB-like dsDNA helicase [Stenotrophomonas phage Summit]
MSNYNLGLTTLHSLVREGNGYQYFRSKLSDQLFRGEIEKEVFKFVNDHFQKYQSLPSVETVAAAYPDFAEVASPEVAKFYVDKLEFRFSMDTLRKANNTVHELLDNDKKDPAGAIAEMEKALGVVKEQQYRSRILDFSQEGPQLVLGTYYGTLGSTASVGGFGWHYMDSMCNGILPGDIVSIVGRPAMGKTWFLLFIALHNWRKLKLNVLFVSMEMNTLAVAQRVAAMYAGTNIGQLKGGVAQGYATANQKKFEAAMQQLAFEEAKFYVVDGNLAASPEDIYILAQQLGCDMICVDGAYLMRSKNPKLGRFERVADNIELMKRYTSEHEKSTICSWQFNRDATKKLEKKATKVGLEDIGYSDAIGQISSIALGLMQEEGVATLETRTVDVMKGRNGEIGSFDVNWLFGAMNFEQVGSDNSGSKQLLHLE